jgi:hypothetical protein
VLDGEKRNLCAHIVVVGAVSGIGFTTYSIHESRLAVLCATRVRPAEFYARLRQYVQMQV